MLNKDRTFTMLISYLKNNSSIHLPQYAFHKHINFYYFNQNIFQIIEGAEHAQINN